MDVDIVERGFLEEGNVRKKKYKRRYGKGGNAYNVSITISGLFPPERRDEKGKVSVGLPHKFR